MSEFKMGDRVARKSSPYKAGVIVEMDGRAGFYPRARILWEHSATRTWVLLTSLSEYTGPQRLITPSNGHIGMNYARKRL